MATDQMSHILFWNEESQKPHIPIVSYLNDFLIASHQPSEVALTMKNSSKLLRGCIK